MPGNPSGRWACSWDAEGNQQPIGPVETTSSGAFDINNAGQVVGFAWRDNSWQSQTPGHAFLWDETNGMRDLGVLDGGTGSTAQAINNAGVVVGWVEFGERDTLAFIWDAENGMGPLESSDGHRLAKANDINDAGQVVGGAVLWENGEFLNLYQDVGRPAGWWFQEFRAINNSGQIVGWGYRNNGPTHALLLTPIPEPATAALLLGGAIALAALARRGLTRPC
jgi:probable HAF family extracellular repeat protein